ncbi:MAG: Dimethylmenaquinone methyltransferase [candidate division NC10 bacterium]|nr:Dimethylmenaquinone methyltransferase [candidate division NC10 bacterium]
MNIIVRDFVRPDPQVIKGFEGIPTGVISDAMGRTGSMAAEIKPVWPRARLVGPALTVRTFPADNLMIHKAVTLAARGDVLVVNSGGYKDTAVFGDLLGYSCKVHGIAGVVIDGASRDAEGMAAIGFPVFARAVLPMGPFKDSPGSINVPVSCGGVAVRPGDIIVADADGVVVVPREEATEVLSKAQGASAKEEQMRERLAKGEYIYDILKLGDVLKGLGVVEK